MKQSEKRLLLVIPIHLQDDLKPIVESEGLHTINDLFRKTGTSYNRHWNGNYVLDQDEIPWKASSDELESLDQLKGRVVVLDELRYKITDKITLYTDKDGSVYVMEDDLKGIFEIA